ILLRDSAIDELAVLNGLKFVLHEGMLRKSGSSGSKSPYSCVGKLPMPGRFSALCQHRLGMEGAVNFDFAIIAHIILPFKDHRAGCTRKDTNRWYHAPAPINASQADGRGQQFVRRRAGSKPVQLVA